MHIYYLQVIQEQQILGLPQEGKDERYVMGQWFDSVAAAVRAYPLRAGTEAAKIIHYDRNTVATLTNRFNGAAQGDAVPSRLEQASAGRHLYNLEQALDAEENYSPPATYMRERMKHLYEVCKNYRIGIVVHTPEPGKIQINLTPQERPTLKPGPRPRRMKLRM